MPLDAGAAGGTAGADDPESPPPPPPHAATTNDAATASAVNLKVLLVFILVSFIGRYAVAPAICLLSSYRATREVKVAKPDPESAFIVDVILLIIHGAGIVRAGKG